MKLTYLLTINFCIFSFFSNAQNKTLGVGTASPNANASLHVESPTNNQGFIMPRLTTVQRDAMSPSLSTVDNGLLVYDTNFKSIFVWDGIQWVTSSKMLLPYADSIVDAAAGAPPLLYLKNAGTTTNGSNVAYFHNSNPNSTGNVLFVSNEGTGASATIAAFNPLQNGPSLYTYTESTLSTSAAFTARTGVTGLGSTATFRLDNPNNPSNTLVAENKGLGRAGNFFVNNTANTNAAIRASTNGSGAAINASNTGTGNGFAGLFSISDPNNTFPAVQASSMGSGSSFRSFQNPGEGIGNGVDVYMYNPTSPGIGVSVDQQGLGNAGYLRVNNPTSNAYGIHVLSNASNASGYFEQTNTGVWTPAIVSRTDGLGAAIAGTSTLNSTNANAAEFVVLNPSNPRFAIMAATEGTGAVIQASHNGPSGNISVFQSSNINVARIDKTGKGFFNGGTQTGGADLAEMFDVEGEANEYEPGDVLVISESTDRTVEKSSTPNSTKVAGVYATKPGVILTERDIEENLDDLVPMGVVGVIPTKVCLENGPIKRGDLLVTSSVKGHAMKANPVIINGVEIYPTGAILGKALENFDSGNTGLIKVLVNVK